MALERRRALVSDALRAFQVEGQAASVEPGTNAGPFAAALARTAIELACTSSGAAVVLTRRSAAGAALRGARDVGAEPRILGARGSGPLPARTPLSLALQGDRTAPAFAAASRFVGDYVATRVAASGTAPGPTSSKVQTGLGRARDAAKAALDFAGARAPVQAAFAPNDPLRKKVGEAWAELEQAEEASRSLRIPVPWTTLASPSPRGRTSAVFFDLSLVPPQHAEPILGLTLASLAASMGEVSEALQGAPLILVSETPAGPLGRFAAQRLASPPEAARAPVLALFLQGPREASAPDFALSAWDGGMLRLPSGAPLPLAAAPEPSDPLSEAEVRALTPPALRARILGDGAAGGGEDEEAAASQEAARDPSASESLEAVRTAAGDLDALARTAARAAARPRPRKEANYEASDFDI